MHLNLLLYIKVLPGLYVCGWLKRGATGQLVHTMQDAYETAESVLEDLTKEDHIQRRGFQGLQEDLSPSTLNKFTSFEDWQKIDKTELFRGQSLGKVNEREKLITVEQMLSACGKS